MQVWRLPIATQGMRTIRSPVHTGLCQNPCTVLTYLVDRMVRSARAEAPTTQERLERGVQISTEWSHSRFDADTHRLERLFPLVSQRGRMPGMGRGRGV
jgi:hypothetical protein